MIIGAHAIIYSTNPEADRAFLRDVFKFSYVDLGDGWLIFRLPPAEVAVHPAESNGVQELFLMCDDIYGLMAEMKSQQVACEELVDARWGLLTHIQLPGGGKLGIYQPRHAQP